MTSASAMAGATMAAIAPQAQLTTGGPAAALLHRFAVGLPAEGTPGRPHPPDRQRLLGFPAAVAAAYRELPVLGTGPLDHADAPVRKSEALRGA